MRNAKYVERYGKLDESVTIAVDGKFKRKIEELKRKKVKFSEWARDVLYSRIHELEEVLEESSTDSEGAA